MNNFLIRPHFFLILLIASAFSDLTFANCSTDADVVMHTALMDLSGNNYNFDMLSINANTSLSELFSKCSSILSRHQQLEVLKKAYISNLPISQIETDSPQVIGLRALLNKWGPEGNEFVSATKLVLDSNSDTNAIFSTLNNRSGNEAELLASKLFQKRTREVLGGDSSPEKIDLIRELGRTYITDPIQYLDLAFNQLPIDKLGFSLEIVERMTQLNDAKLTPMSACKLVQVGHYISTSFKSPEKGAPPGAQLYIETLEKVYNKLTTHKQKQFPCNDEHSVESFLKVIDLNLTEIERRYGFSINKKTTPKENSGLTAVAKPTVGCDKEEVKKWLRSEVYDQFHGQIPVFSAKGKVNYKPKPRTPYFGGTQFKGNCHTYLTVIPSEKTITLQGSRKKIKQKMATVKIEIRKPLSKVFEFETPDELLEYNLYKTFVEAGLVIPVVTVAPTGGSKTIVPSVPAKR